MEAREHKGVAARALEFTILTAGRTSEVIGASWDEIEGDVWTAPKGGMKGGRAMIMTLRGMCRGDLTTHGFGSTFRDRCGECTEFAREVAEAALAYAIRDRAEQAYRRGDALEKPCKLMEACSAYCEQANVASNADDQTAA